MSKYQPCPCGSKRMYHQCCKPYHDGALPETAEKLMRSRYSAYALGLADYIMSTTHPENPNYSNNKDQWKAEIMLFSGENRFLGLKIVETSDGADPVKGGASDGSERATVTFVAHIGHGARDASFKEKSEFAKVDGRWLYLDGEVSHES